MIIFKVKVHIATDTLPPPPPKMFIIATFAVCSVCNPVSLGRLWTGGEHCADMEPELSGDMDTGTLATAGTPHCSMIYNSNAEHTANTASTWTQCHHSGLCRVSGKHHL